MLDNRGPVILSLRFVSALALAAMLIGLSGRLAPLALAGVVLIALVVALAALDWRRLARVRLEVSRSCDEKLSLGAENAVRISIRNPGYARVVGWLRDEYPEGFCAVGNVMRLELPARSEHELVYHVTPPRRGDFEFGEIYVRLNGPLGLVSRQTMYPARQPVKVYPNLLDIRRYEIGLRRERPLQPGQRVTRVRGRGTDFESLRDYVPDDEFRAVDWKASARRGKLTTRQYQEEKSQNVLIVLDCGRVMGPVILIPPPVGGGRGELGKPPSSQEGGWGEVGLTRLDHAINAAVMLGHVASQKGDRVGLMAFAEDVISYSPPRAGKSQVLNLLRLTYNLKEASGDSNYSRAIPFLARKWTRRSLILFFTDLIDPDSSKPLTTQIAALAKKHICVVISMSDPAVLDAAHGPFESPDDAFLAAAARQVLHARRQAAAQLARLGAIVLDLPPDKFTPSVVNEYLNLKSRGQL